MVNFVDEEGARFGVACAGSRIITGALTADRARSLSDANGVSMAQAWTSQRVETPRRSGPDERALARIACFVELHVEQGKALALTADSGVDLDDPARAVAIGTDVWPHGRWRVDIAGGGQPRRYDPPRRPPRRHARPRRAW